MHRTARNDAVAERILARVGGRAASLDTLKACVDPFHDSEIDPQGWPDLTTSPSCVQIYKASMTITAPTNLPATGTWDCHIFNQPVLQLDGGGTNAIVPAAQLIYGQVAAQNVSAAQYSNSVGFSPIGLTAVSFNTASGPPTDFSLVTPSTVAPNVVAIQCLTLPNTLVQGATRVFAQGFEVHNTTAQLYKGGSVLCYRMPLDDDVYHATVGLVPTAAGPISWIETLPTPSPPATLSAALQLKGSRQWGAENGSYTVCGLHTQNLPCNGNTFLYPSFYNLGSFDNTATQTTYQMNTVTISTQAVFAARSSLWTEFDVSGNWYTGLTPQTTLTINWNVFVERFPSPVNTDLVLLAKQSPEYDVGAMELISAIMRTMPVATFVGDNSTGSWFTDILETGANYVAPLLSAMPHPVAKGIGGAITAGSTMMKAWNAKPAAERNAINQQTQAAVRRMAGGGGKAKKSKSKRSKRLPAFQGPMPKGAGRGRIQVTPWIGKRQANNRIGPRRENGRF